jgi:hypothetical protein
MNHRKNVLATENNYLLYYDKLQMSLDVAINEGKKYFIEKI